MPSGQTVLNGEKDSKERKMNSNEEWMIERGLNDGTSFEQTNLGSPQISPSRRMSSGIYCLI